jgi:hypothetical protein
MSPAPGRFGVSWTLQLLPSHRSATVDGWNCAEGVKTSPVAVQAEGDEQETPLKKSPCVPGGVGVD